MNIVEFIVLTEAARLHCMMNMLNMAAMLYQNVLNAVLTETVLTV